MLINRLKPKETFFQHRNKQDQRLSVKFKDFFF